MPRSDALSRLGRSVHSALAAIFPALASAELFRRLAVTICMLALVRVGHYIPLPSLNLSAILNPIAAGGAGTAYSNMSIASFFSGAGELPGNLYLLSITPYMSAHFLLAILQVALPNFRSTMNKLRDEGRQGREAMNSYINFAFILCAITQAFVETWRLTPLATVESAQGWLFKVQSALSLFAGAVICKFAVQTVDQWGLGDGTGLVIGAGIAVGRILLIFWSRYTAFIAYMLLQAYSQMSAAVVNALISLRPHPGALAASLALLFSLVSLVVWVQGIDLRLPLTFFLRRRSTVQSTHPVLRMLSKGVDSGGALDQQQLLPLRLSPAGTRQLLFANFWAGTFAAPLKWIGLGGFLSNPWAFAALVFVLEAVSISDATPRQAADFLAQSDAGVRGISPGLNTERFLASRRRQMKALNAAFIAVVSLAAYSVDAACAWLIGMPLGCLNLLLLVSTILGGARQIDALMQGPKVGRMIANEYAVLEEVGAQKGSQQE